MCLLRCRIATVPATVPATGSVKIETDTNDSSITDGGMAVYTGACGGLSLYACNDSGNTDSLEDFERINVYGRTPGEVLYVRVWSYDDIETGTFNICAEEIQQPQAPIATVSLVFV